MAISSAITAALTDFAANVTAAAPLASATSILLSALKSEGAELVAKIEAELDSNETPLDSADPSGFPGEMVSALSELAQSAEDQTDLCDMRGHVGRALFNLSQVSA